MHGPFFRRDQRDLIRAPFPPAMKHLAQLLLLLPTIAAAQLPVRYEVAFPNAVHHEARITVAFEGLAAGPLELRMSRSSPGRYALHEFAKNVYAVEAVDGAGKPLRITRPDPHQWNVEGHDGTARVTYTLFADRADGTYSAIDATHAHLNMPATFMWARGLGERPISVRFTLPDTAWRIATQLLPGGDAHTYRAPNLQYFMDSPTEIGPLDIRTWSLSSGGKAQTIRLALHHTGSRQDADAYAEMAKKVVREQVGVFGEAPDFDAGTYTFIADYLPHASGDGMEHRNSTILTSSQSLSANATGLLGTLSHEFFHAWNVERIRPRSLEPFDFERANMSGELWFAEGFTSYYGPLVIHRAGIVPFERYAANLAGGLNAVINGPGRRFFSPVEMSLQAPFVDAAASIDPQNKANTFISYYTWGAALGLGLDLTLRSRFTGVTLDDLMRDLWRTHGATERPYTHDDLRAALGRVTRDTAFARDFFSRYIEGREVVDYAALLARAGIRLRPAASGQPFIGGPIEFEGDTAIVAGGTIIGTPLYEAGLDRGDRIASLGGRPLTSAAVLDEILSTRKPGDRLAVEFVQRGAVRSGSIIVAQDARLEAVTFEQAGERVTPAIRTFRQRWLGSRAMP